MLELLIKMQPSSLFITTTADFFIKKPMKKLIKIQIGPKRATKIIFAITRGSMHPQHFIKLGNFK